MIFPRVPQTCNGQWQTQPDVAAPTDAMATVARKPNIVILKIFRERAFFVTFFVTFIGVSFVVVSC